ncbi:lipid II:glycine glycyltransferase FemX [Brevibacterium sp. UCMA 11754]|uniref:lipid II:glycine glycyltransferase FemX n=1 Tax=Brevibacterium sp. UCMA 11754 TaxID=2749198 RepID=UPI001F3DA8E8|nr:peptidoglycan bridge formation glycyltransferase FemA/FemB family protein [Brevibacterium sp. UCMA 11754]MCF2573445.1 peptidoglycan bridge formation glycyltransferase FemA/FemB family protein [Brevibacterium sp. UCMA 11754]
MYTVRTIQTDEFWRFLDRTGGASYQQTPEWGRARSADWGHELVGWFGSGDEPVSAAVIRYRRLPGADLRFAFIPQGPLIDWTSPDLSDQFSALEAHLRSRRVFGLRITPPVTLRRWDAATVKAGLADDDIARFSDLAPDDVSPVALRLVRVLKELGWREACGDADSDASQPRMNFHLSLDGGSEETALARMSKAWRKNIRKAERAEVEVALGGPDDLGDVHRLYLETAGRNGFDPQPLGYFEAMWNSMGREFPGSFALDIARHEGTAVAASATALVGRRAQGVFAATSGIRPQTKPSNAVYWTIIRRAIAEGAEVFDIGGVDDTLDDSDPAAGLIRFKADMGADAHEYIGTWDLPLRPQIYTLFTKLLPLRARLRAGVPARLLRHPARTSPIRPETESASIAFR